MHLIFAHYGRLTFQMAHSGAAVPALMAVTGTSIFSRSFFQLLTSWPLDCPGHDDVTPMVQCTLAHLEARRNSYGRRDQYKLNSISFTPTAFSLGLLPGSGMWMARTMQLMCLHAENAMPEHAQLSVHSKKDWKQGGNFALLCLLQ